MRRAILICFFVVAMTMLSTGCKSASQSPDHDSSIASNVTTNVNANTASLFPAYESYQLDSAVEKLINDNPIDKAYIIEEKKFNAQTTYDELEFVGKYANLWDVEMNATLAKLRSKLSEKNLKELNKSQTDWEAFVKSDVNLACDIQVATAGQGTGIPLLNAYKMLGRYRYRTLELAEYYYMITGNFKFEYK